MRSLEEEIDDLSDLDSLRIRSGELRDEGRKALEGLLINWESANDRVEDASVVKALSIRIARKEPPKKLVQALESMTLKDVFAISGSDDKGDRVPILRSARALQALAAAPDSALAKSALFFYYQIAREVYLADAPDWTTGGARAGDAGPPTAFITGECMRAILSLARTLENTATYVDGIAEMQKQRKRLEREEIPREWREAEAERVQIAFSTTIETLTRNIALRLQQRKPKPPFDLSSISAYLKNAPSDLEHAIRENAKDFASAKNAIIRFRNGERSRAESDRDSRNLHRSESGHLIALAAIERAVAQSKEALKHCRENKWTELSDLFRNEARAVRRMMLPAKGFVSAVLDRELAAAASDDRLGWDPGEMAFAAASYGAITSAWDEERLARAVRCLSKVLSERGRFPVGRPFYWRRQGYRLHVFGCEILRAFAQLLQKVHAVPLEPDLVRRMLVFFQDTRASRGWRHENARGGHQPDRSVTAVAVLALDRINRMLDERINERVFNHFSVKRRGGVDLRALFYPDYGLRLAPPKIARLDSVAIHLERMRAHVAGVRPPREDLDPLYSMILHGPPGTGKTTLVEALAASCGVPLVEITPSDIVYGGEAAVERRARAVFYALSLLTRVVIIFDEFDPVLRRRKADDSKQPTVFSFLTPGMLPKLRTLNKSAGRRSAAYVLITNLVGTLDEAAIRSGRFDCLMGIYPPDLLSRTGRFLSELMDYQRLKPEFKEVSLDTGNIRVAAVVRKTAGGAMQCLGAKGWFVGPGLNDKIGKGNPFDFVFHMEKEPSWSEPEAKISKVLGEGEAAEREYQQWKWIVEWDNLNAGSLRDALDNVPTSEPKPRPARSSRRHPSGT